MERLVGAIFVALKDHTGDDLGDFVVEQVAGIQRRRNVEGTSRTIIQVRTNAVASFTRDNAAVIDLRRRGA
jgi:hypothetical protein